MNTPGEGIGKLQQLELLQEEIQVLKNRWGRALRLQRATMAEAPSTAPFPIVLTFQVDPPHAAAAHYDVSAVRIQIHLSPAVLQLQLQAAARGCGDGRGGAATTLHQSLPSGTNVVVQSEELPGMLRNRIAQELAQDWLRALRDPGTAQGSEGGRDPLKCGIGGGSNNSGGNASGGSFGGGGSGGGGSMAFSPFKLSAAASCMQERFVQLICLVPELVEPYQAVDDHGATVRRYAILNGDADVGIPAESPTGATEVRSGVPQRRNSPSAVGPICSTAAVGKGTAGSIEPGATPRDVKASTNTATAAAVMRSPSTTRAAIQLSPSLGLTAAATTSASAPATGSTGPVVAAQVLATSTLSNAPMEPVAIGGTTRPHVTVRSGPEVRQTVTYHQWPSDAVLGPHDMGPLADRPSTSTSTSASTSASACSTRAVASADNLQTSRQFDPAGHEAGSMQRSGTFASNSAAAQTEYSTLKVSDPASQGAAVAVAAPSNSETSSGFSAHAAPGSKPVASRTAPEFNSTLEALQPPALPPPGLMSYSIALKELQYIHKRYSQVFSARVHREGPDGGVAATAGLGFGAGGGSGGGSQALLKAGCLTTFELELLPTDPDWDMPAVRVVGQLVPVSDLTYLPSLGVHLGSRLPSWLRAALETHMAQQLASQASQVEAKAEADAAAAAVTEAQPLTPPLDASGARGIGLPQGGGGRELRDRGRRGRGGVSSRAGGVGVTGTEDELAPEGTVLLPLGTLRNLFRDLENYAGAMARALVEERLRGEHDTVVGSGGTGAGASSGCKNDGIDNAGSKYDDDGYGDGSRRGASGAAAPADGEGLEGYDNSDGGDSDDGEDDGDDDAAAADEIRFSGTAAAAAGSGADAPAAYAVLLEGLQLDNLAAVEVLRANFEISCSRCGARDTAVVASSAVAGGGGSGHQATATGQCQKCTTAWSLVMRPHFVHATSNSLCVIKPEGCRPVDLLPSLLAGQCGECNAVMSLREVQVGLPFSRHCSSCHKEISISVAAVSFVPRGPPRGGSTATGAANRGVARAGAAAAARRARGDVGGGGSGSLRPGQPLPALGTCKHYRHSYRWLRFPCCGMRFPCDLCHEEGVPDGHPVRWAQRMVCGFCSTEQPLALACRACGRQLAGSAANPTGRKTRFWEGGTGCRDPRRLNKDDPHKWRGRNKTISAKQARVGPKPWSGKAGGGGGSGSG